MAIAALIEDWIAMRATLRRHLKLMKDSEAQGQVANADAAATMAHLKICVTELTAPLKEHARDPSP